MQVYSAIELVSEDLINTFFDSLRDTKHPVTIVRSIKKPEYIKLRFKRASRESRSHICKADVAMLSAYRENLSFSLTRARDIKNTHGG